MRHGAVNVAALSDARRAGVLDRARIHAKAQVVVAVDGPMPAGRER